MKTLVFLFFAIFLFFSSNRQESKNYFNSFAGDTAISLGKNFYTNDLGDTTIFTLSKGLYRIIFDKGINNQVDLDFQVIDDNNKKINTSETEGYSDFYNEYTGKLQFIATANQPIKDELLGKLYKIYSKNIKKTAPHFTFKDIEGNEYSNESLMGKIVVFNFWGVSCRPCVAEIPHLNNLVNKYNSREDVIFLALTSDPVERLREFLQKRPFNYHHISIKNDVDLIVKIIDLDIIALPTHAIIDKNGNVVFQYLGDHKEIERLISESIEKLN